MQKMYIRKSSFSNEPNLKEYRVKGLTIRKLRLSLTRIPNEFVSYVHKYKLSMRISDEFNHGMRLEHKAQGSLFRLDVVEHVFGSGDLFEMDSRTDEFEGSRISTKNCDSNAMKADGISNFEESLIFENIGRDVRPFYHQRTKDKLSGAPILKIHTKSQGSKLNSEWNSLHKKFVEVVMETDLVSKMEENDIDLCFPNFLGTLPRYHLGWGKRNKRLERMLTNGEKTPKVFPYPSGSVFLISWRLYCEISRISNVAEHMYPVETGQLDGELQHYLERLVAWKPLNRGQKIGIVDVSTRTIGLFSSI